MDRSELAQDIWLHTGTGNRRTAARRLFDGWCAGELSPEDLARLIPDVWLWLDPPAGPRGALSDDEWVALFRAAGRLVNGPRVPNGVNAPMLFRAAPEDRARGMSWCTHRSMAERFLPRHHLWGDYKIWTVLAPQGAILATLYRPDDAFVDAAGEVGLEIVVDPAALPDPAPADDEPFRR